jgi:hypothetical protein
VKSRAVPSLSGILPRNANVWLPGYIRSRIRTWRRSTAVVGPTHVIFCVADHFEPDHGRAFLQQQHDRVARWSVEYPALADQFRDADGRPPQHSFFFPAEAYRPEHLDPLAEICAKGFGEVEVHLHHGNDTAARLRAQLEEFTSTLAERHGLLSRHPDGRLAYGFIHGNWALDNSGVDASTCGVNEELTVLRETGCYADFTMPAAPDSAQSRVVNSIYYAEDDRNAPRSYDTGFPVRVDSRPPQDGFMLIEGPLVLWWPKPLRSLLPRIDAGAIDASPGNRPSISRFARWVEADIIVEGRPEWRFVKVHTHGAPERNANVLLGADMLEFHRRVGEEFNDGSRYKLHYVTAREMFNIVKAAEAGYTGDPSAFRDFVIQRDDLV